MISIEDLVALDEDLRAAGFEVSTQQQLAAQQVVRLLALGGALPRDAADLAGTLGPIFCTSAVQQQRFPAVYAQWMRQRFRASPPGPAADAAPAPRPAPRRRLASWIAAALAVAVAGVVAHRLIPRPIDSGPTPVPTTTPTAPPTAPPTVPPPPDADDPELPAARLVGLDSRLAISDPAARDRVRPGNALIVLAPFAAFALWQLLRLARRPVLRRLSSRAPSALREVHLPGGARTLLPGLPLRRTAQELRRRRLVASRELQVEATVAASLRKGGVFTPVVGSRVEPSHLALVDRASLSDHQARLADVVLGQLAASDVQLDAFDFDRDARTCRPRTVATTARAAARRGRADAVSLEELRVRWPDHRVLVFADASAAFDPFTGAPAPWVATLAGWPTAVVVTPRPPEAWGLRELRLQQCGVALVPLSRAGMQALMGIASETPAAAAAPPSAPAAPRPLHEQTATRWLERDAPPPETVARLCDGLRTELGRDGFAWLAGCAAYPEVHWGITLRMGAVLVPEPAARERILPRLARLVWFRRAYLPDWLREALLDRLDAASEARVRSALDALLAGLVESGGDVPLRIAVGPPPGAGRWARLRRLLRAPARGRDVADASPPDSPLRDQVFLRFVSGRSSSRLDATAPERLLARLRRDGLHLVRSPLGGLLVAALASTALAARWPPLSLGPPVRQDVAAAFLDDDTLAVATVAGFESNGHPLGLHLVRWTRRDGAWSSSAGRIGSVAPSGPPWPVAFGPGGRYLVWVPPDVEIATWDVVANALQAQVRSDRRPTSVAVDASGRRLAAADGREVWTSDLDSSTGRTILQGGWARKTLVFSGSPGAPDRASDVLAAGSESSTLVEPFAGGQRRIVAGEVLALGADGRTLATRLDGRLRGWTLNDEGRYTPSTADLRDARRPAGAALSPNGRWLAAFDEGGAAWLRDLVNAADVPATALGAGVPRLAAFSPSNRLLALAGGAGGQIELWQTPRRATLEVPVVVHVLYADDPQNLSDDVIAGQLKVLNDDFNARNADLATVPAPFRSRIGDAAITFRLATTDPSGAPTSGITRTRVPARLAGGFEMQGTFDVYSTARGGADAWPADRYLNLWAAPLAGSIVGWGQPPGGDPRTDGVVLASQVVGAAGRLTAAFDRGRTATSEVALYLGLRNVWGDDGSACSGSDGVDDTPNQAGPNTGVPTFPHVTCDNGPAGDMFMNFMDHSDDAARVMFTNGQVERMRRTLRGPRARLVGRPVPAAASPGPPAQTQAPAATPVPPKGFIRVESQPTGAIVRVNGARRGVTPLDLRGLGFGEYVIEVELWGYTPAKRSVVVSAGRPVHKLDVRLELPATATEG